MYDQASTNGCSIEAVGTHSLMSKDSRDKEPMRPEAVAFAKHASASVAKLLLDRVYSATPLSEGLDWDTLLRFYVRGAPTAPLSGPWETELLQGVHAGRHVPPAARGRGVAAAQLRPARPDPRPGQAGGEAGRAPPRTTSRPTTGGSSPT